MYKVLIVEDEVIIRKALPLMIDWQGIGFNVAGTAVNGMDALRFLKKNKVDVVLTDIRMPEINGLELACEIRTRYSSIKTILLSAYGEFEYAIKAIEYGIYGYLLKSDDFSEIGVYFSKLKNQLDRLNKRIGLSGLSGETDDKESHTFCSNDLKKLLTGTASKNVSRENKYMQSKCFLSSFLEVDEPVVAVIELDEPVILEAFLGHRTFVELAVRLEELSSRLFEDQGLGYVTCVHSRVVVLFNRPFNEVRAILIDAIKELSDQLLINDSGVEITVSCSMAGSGHSFSEIGNIYYEAVEALGRKLYLGTGRFIDASEAYKPAAGEELIENEKPEQYSTMIANHLISSNIPEINSILDTLQKRIIKLGGNRNDRIAFFLKMLVSIHEKAGGRYFDHTLFAETLVLVEKCETIPGMLKIIRDGLVQACNLSSRTMGNNEQINGLVKKVINYIEANFSTEISLDMLAEQVNINPVYLSRLFVQQTGINYKSMLQTIRLERAKELLKDLNYKIYEISEMVGYKKPRYFSELFKDRTGLTPLEYREKFSPVKVGGNLQ